MNHNATLFCTCSEHSPWKGITANDGAKLQSYIDRSLLCHDGNHASRDFIEEKFAHVTPSTTVEERCITCDKVDCQGDYSVWMNTFPPKKMCGECSKNGKFSVSLRTTNNAEDGSVTVATTATTPRIPQQRNLMEALKRLREASNENHENIIPPIAIPINHTNAPQALPTILEIQQADDDNNNDINLDNDPVSNFEEGFLDFFGEDDKESEDIKEDEEVEAFSGAAVDVARGENENEAAGDGSEDNNEDDREDDDIGSRNADADVDAADSNNDEGNNVNEVGVHQPEGGDEKGEEKQNAATTDKTKEAVAGDKVLVEQAGEEKQNAATAADTDKTKEDTEEAVMVQAGSLIQYRVNGTDDGTDDGTDELFVAMINANVDGGTVATPCTALEEMTEWQLLAECVNGMKYNYDVGKQGWTQKKHVTVLGRLCEEDCEKLYRIIVAELSECRKGLQPQVRTSILDTYVRRCTPSANMFFLDDRMVDDQGGENPARMVPILRTESNTNALLRHYISDAAYFRPIPYTAMNIFIIIGAYDALEWFKDNSNSGQISAESRDIIQTFLKTTTDPMQMQSLHLTSVLGYAVALTRLFASVVRAGTMMKKLDCLCCTIKSEEECNRCGGRLDVPVFVPTFLEATTKAISANDNKDLESFFGLGQTKIDHLETDCKRVHQVLSGNITVDSFLVGRRRFKICDDGVGWATLGLSVICYIYLPRANSQFFDIIGELRRNIQIPFSYVRKTASDEETEFMTAIVNCTKAGTSLGKYFGCNQDRLGEKAEYTMTFAKVLQELWSGASMSVTEVLTQAFRLAQSYSVQTLMEKNDVHTLPTSIDLDTKVVNMVSTWGDSIAEADNWIHRSQSKAVLLHSTWKQLGVLKGFFLGPIVPMMTEKSIQVDNRFLENEQIAMNVAMNPKVGDDMKKQLTTALDGVGINVTLITVPPIVDVVLDEVQSLAFGQITQAYGFKIGSFEMMATKLLLARANETNLPELFDDSLQPVYVSHCKHILYDVNSRTDS